MSISSKSIIHKLINRQVHGTYEYKHNVQNSTRYLLNEIPDHCKIHLPNIIEDRHILLTHKFIGLTRNGQFLMSFTKHEENYEYWLYKLHFWAFQMGQKAFRVSEIVLFRKYKIKRDLSIQVIEWPNRPDRIVVIGQSYIIPGIYITISKLPSLNNCKDCQSIINEANEKRIKDSRWHNLEKVCPIHGLSVHTSSKMFDLNPKPSISLKYDDHIVLRTEYFIYILNIDLDHKQVIESDQSEIINVPISHNLSIDLTKLGYKIPIENDNQERSVEKELIDTNFYLNKYLMNTLMMSASAMNNQILKEVHAAKNIIVTELDQRIISKNLAVIICNLEGYIFWSQEFYDSDILDVCPINGDLLIAYVLFVNTLVIEGRTRGHLWTFGNFITKCVVLWSADTKKCTLEGYSAPIKNVISSAMGSARNQAAELYEAGLGFFNIDTRNKVRSLNTLWYNQGRNYSNTKDEENMIIISKN